MDDKEKQTQNEEAEEIEKKEDKEDNKKTKVDELFDNEYEEEKTRKKGKGRHSK